MFLQLSIDHHNIDVQCVCNISFPVLPNQLESVRLNIGGRTVARSLYGHVITTFSGVDRFS